MSPSLKEMLNVARSRILRCILFAGIPAAIFYVLCVVALYLKGFKIMEIIRDPAQQAAQSSFLGFISNVGTWLWVSSTAVCFFGIANGGFSSQRKDRELLVLAGLFSLTLAVDDFFMIHDRYIHQYICYTGYALIAIALLVRHFRRIIEIDGFAFILAGALLALSIFSDVAQMLIPLPYVLVQLFEEGFKFVGAATWLFFCGRLAIVTLNERTAGDIESLS
jgi:hypothetical protein